MFRVSGIACALLACAFTLSGCPELLIGADLSGLYEGTWQIPAEEEGGETESCPISLELAHFPGANNLEDATLVTGYINLDFTCFSVLNAVLLLQQIEVGEIEVTGYAIAGGTFLLRSVDLTGGCNSDLCISLVLTGQARDTDSDGMADELSGEWSALFPFPASGSFEAEIVSEP